MTGGPMGWFRRLGPGLLWAGTAVGVSHLVQSTRAGAGYGLSLAWIVVVAHVLKYPAFEAGPRYTAATGRSLLEAYRRQGRGALAVFFAITVSTMCIVEAAIAVVTAGMASALVTDAVSVSGWAATLLGLAVLLSATGGFKALDAAMKAMVLLLTGSTALAVVLLLPQTSWAALSPWPPLPALDAATIGFLVAFVGWMPAPFDTAVWHSMWSVEKVREDAGFDRRAARIDFHVGYVGTALLALLFVFLGAAVLHGRDIELPAQAPAFARTFVDVYASVLGEASRPVVLTAAFATMLSTTLAVADGFARALAGCVRRFGGEEAPGEAVDRPVYLASLVGIAVGSWGIVAFLTANLKALVDLATTVSFVLTPVLAWMNYRAVTSDEVPEAHRPGPWLVLGHQVGVVAMTVFSIGYVGFRLAGG